MIKSDHEEKFKTEGYEYIIGVDEAGRGPLAGPVVASAVLLKNPKFTCRIDDSKKLSLKQRVEAFHQIYDNAIVGLGVMSEVIIDQNNILEATYLAMNDAIDKVVSKLMVELGTKEKDLKKILILVDGHRFKSQLPFDYKTIIGGDALVPSIACASIVAKVTRDRILDTYDKILPQWGFGQHKGYPTMKHKQAIRRFGLSLIHRKSFHYGSTL